MSMFIRESINENNKKDFFVDWHYNREKLNIKESNTSIFNESPNSINVDIEALHEFPVSTRNFTRYHKEALQGSIPTWTSPYNRPVILHHNEDNGKIIGRVTDASYKTKDTLSNTPALILHSNISDKDGIEGVKDGRLKTTSIGAIIDDCKCSICGQNIATDGPCNHEPGEVYDGKICYWDIYSMEAKEISYVIVPSDPYSQNIKIYNNKKTEIKEKYNGTKGATKMTEQEFKSKVEQLEKDLNDSKKIAEDNKKENEETSKKYNEIIKKLDEANKTIEKITKEAKEKESEIVVLKADLVKEQQTKCSLEQEIEKKDIEVRESMVSRFMTLREALNKPKIEKADIEKRDTNSLKYSILDLQEEMNSKPNISNIKTLSGKGIIESATNNNKLTTEDLDKKIDLNDECQTLMANLLR